jgi:outer membrane receptor protein involved in Fe transport
MLVRATFCVGLLATAPTAAAGDVVISGSRSEAGKRSTTPNALDVLDRAALDEGGETTLPDAIAKLPGIGFQETNPGAGVPIMRGLMGPDNLITIDGIRFNTAAFRTGPNQYTGTLGLYSLERIELRYGASSVLYGNGAVGGVLNLVTRDLLAKDPYSAISLSAAGQGENAAGGSLLLRHRAGALSLIATGHARRVFERNHGGINGGGASAWNLITGNPDGTWVPGSDSEQADWMVKAGYDLNPRLRVEAAYLGLALDGADRADKLAKGDHRRYDNTDHFAYLKLKARGDRLAYSEVYAGFHSTGEAVRRDTCETADGPPLAPHDCLTGIDGAVGDHLTERRQSDDSVTVLQAGFNARLKKIGLLTVRFGGEWAEESIHSTESRGKASEGFAFSERPRGNFGDGSTYGSGGLYAHGRLRLCGPGQACDTPYRVDLNGGARLSLFRAFAPASGGLEEDVNTRFSGVVGELQLALSRPRRGVTWLGYSQGFRAPNLQEATVLGDTGSKFEIPNPDLQPQRGDTFELGTRRLFKSQVVRAVAYYTALRDVIDEAEATYQGQASVDGDPVIQRVNARLGEFYGADLGVSLGRGALRTGHSLGVIHGSIERSDGWVAARRVPPLRGAHTVSYHANPVLTHSASLRWAASQTELHPSDRKDLRICADPAAPWSSLGDACTGTPGWAVIGLRSQWRPRPTRRLTAALDNLTDANTKSHGSGPLAPGITLRLTYEERF